MGAAPNVYFASVKVNQVEIRDDELEKIIFTTYLGNQMPTLRFQCTSKRSLLFDNFLVEMSVVDVELGFSDANMAPSITKKGRFFVAYVKREEHKGKGRHTYTAYCIADARKYIEEPQIMATTAKVKSLKFLERVPGLFGGNGPGSGSMKLYIEDGLISRTKGEQYWIQHDLSGIESVNQLMVRNLIEDKPSGGKDEWIAVPCIDFDRSGGPVMYVYDLKLRCQTFPEKGLSIGVPAKFNYKQDPGTVNYSEARFQMLGAEHSVKYWQRQAASLDVEEALVDYKEVDPPKLFQDSLDYAEQQVFDGNGDIPSVFPMLKSGERYLVDGRNTNFYDKEYTSQRLQYSTVLLALMKLNVKLSFLGRFLDIRPIDICHIALGKQESDGAMTDNMRLTTKYCTTKVSYVYESRTINTFVTASRDTYTSTPTPRVVD